MEYAPARRDVERNGVMAVIIMDMCSISETRIMAESQ